MSPGKFTDSVNQLEPRSEMHSEMDEAITASAIPEWPDARMTRETLDGHSSLGFQPMEIPLMEAMD